MMRLMKKVSSSFSRPNNTTAYTAGDYIANSLSAGTCVPMHFHVGDGGFRIKAAHITKTDETDVANADFSLHLFDTCPTVANGDNGALSFDYSNKFADIDFPTMVAATDFAWAASDGLDINWHTSGWVHGLLEADGAYTPASGETFEVFLIFEAFHGG